MGSAYLDNITAHRYLEFLREPVLALLYPNREDIPSGNIWFEQEGAPTNYARPDILFTPTFLGLYKK